MEMTLATRAWPMRVVAVLVILLGGPWLQAQDVARIFPFPVNVYELDNGLRVVGIPYDSPGIVAYYTVVRTGSRNEVQYSGYAHFFEHMMFRGTDRYPTDAYNAVVKQMGADANAFTTDDWTAYHLVASSEALETIMDIESDRFLNLQYSEDDFKTEAGAILGEYNLNFSNPLAVVRETLYGLAYREHPYRHTTIGRLEHIQDMPNHYDYSLEFYDRYYRPENCLIVVVGDFDQARLEELAVQYYGEWDRGTVTPVIPEEPPQDGERTARLTWPNPTLPYLMIGYRAPAFSDQAIDMPALDVLSQLLFSQTSPLFQTLVIEQQLVDVVTGGAGDHRDPPLFEVIARVTKPDRVEDVRDSILAEIDRMKEEPVSEALLADTKAHMRYSFAMGLDDPDAIASTMGHYLQLTTDPETVNRVYALYDRVTSADVQEVARRYFGEKSRTVVTLTQE